MPISPFRQTGPTIVIIATTAANAQQCLSTEATGNQQYIVTNSDTSNDAYVTFAPNEGLAIAQAVVPSITLPQNVYRVLHASQVTLTGPANAWIGAIAPSASARIDITPGYGS